jgi:hypothetical protein
MYAVYKQAHPPTGLEFAMYCNFFNNSERNLVVAGTSQLYVYRLNRDAEVGRVPSGRRRRGRRAAARAASPLQGPGFVLGPVSPEPVLLRCVVRPRPTPEGTRLPSRAPAGCWVVETRQ